MGRSAPPFGGVQLRLCFTKGIPAPPFPSLAVCLILFAHSIKKGKGIYVRVHRKSWKKIKSKLKELSS